MFSILAICNNKTLLNSIHYFARVGSKFCPKLNKPSKNCQILLKFCLQLWIFAKSGHTASTINHPPPAPPSQMHYLRQKNEPSQPQMQLKYQAGEAKNNFSYFLSSRCTFSLSLFSLFSLWVRFVRHMTNILQRNWSLFAKIKKRRLFLKLPISTSRVHDARAF